MQTQSSFSYKGENPMLKKRAGMTVKVTLTINPDRKTIKAKKQVSQGKQRALRTKVQAQIKQAERQIKQIEKVGLQSTPAIDKLKERKTTLTTKGKNYNQLQSTYFSLDKFLKAQTSTAHGALKVLKQTAEIIGEKDKSPEGLKGLATEFFNVAKLVQEYMKTEQDYSATSPRVFEAVRRIKKEMADIWSMAGSTAERADIVIQQLKKEIATTKKYEMMDYASEKIEQEFTAAALSQGFHEL